MVLARMVKKAAKSPLKNISSEPEPDHDADGQHRRSIVDDLALLALGGSAETAWVTGQFLVDQSCRRANKQVTAFSCSVPGGQLGQLSGSAQLDGQWFGMHAPPVAGSVG